MSRFGNVVEGRFDSFDVLSPFVNRLKNIWACLRVGRIRRRRRAIASRRPFERAAFPWGPAGICWCSRSSRVASRSPCASHPGARWRFWSSCGNASGASASFVVAPKSRPVLRWTTLAKSRTWLLWAIGTAMETTGVNWCRKVD